MGRTLRVLVGMFIALLAMGAGADSWDHDANIGMAVEAFVSVYNTGGIDSAASFVADCYREIGEADEAEDQLRRMEYCAGMDFAGYLVDRHSAEVEHTPQTGFFTPENLFTRMQRLKEWVSDPAAENQVLRAWASAAADALSREIQ